MPRTPGHPCAALAAAVALAGTGVAMAQSASPADPAASGDVLARPAPSVDELMKRLDTLEDRNRELEARVTDLNRQQGEEWLGEQRAGQIRDIVRDVLADSDPIMRAAKLAFLATPIYRGVLENLIEKDLLFFLSLPDDVKLAGSGQRHCPAAGANAKHLRRALCCPLPLQRKQPRLQRHGCPAPPCRGRQPARPEWGDVRMPHP